jgi:hypothetical protein
MPCRMHGGNAATCPICRQPKKLFVKSLTREISTIKDYFCREKIDGVGLLPGVSKSGPGAGQAGSHGAQ